MPMQLQEEDASRHSSQEDRDPKSAPGPLPRRAGASTSAKQPSSPGRCPLEGTATNPSPAGERSSVPVWPAEAEALRRRHRRTHPPPAGANHKTWAIKKKFWRSGTCTFFWWARSRKEGIRGCIEADFRKKDFLEYSELQDFRDHFAS